MSFLALPTELLDAIFAYLDWDRTKHLRPAKQDIFSASLTCKQLRRALAPTLFRDVVLRLRWADKDLLEPHLFKLRKECPELAKHIRCIFIRAEYEDCRHCAERNNAMRFATPEKIQDWLSPSAQATSEEQQDRPYRARVNALAQQIVNPMTAAGSSSNAMEETAEEAILSYNRRNGCNADLDALSIVMLTIPSTTTAIVFQSLTDNYMHESKNNFAVRVLATALDLHRHRLRDLTMISNSAASRLTMSRRALARLGTGGLEMPAISPDVLGDMKIRRLVIAMNNKDALRTGSGMLISQSYRRWHQMSHCVQELELYSVRADVSEMLQFIKGFQSLKTARIRQCVLGLPRGNMVARLREAEANIWLVFAIELRRCMPECDIELHHVLNSTVATHLPHSAVQWICTQATPRGALIDAEREQRLVEDFDSFFTLWEAENGLRGSQALDAWATQRGQLSDEAMSRRWR